MSCFVAALFPPFRFCGCGRSGRAGRPIDGDEELLRILEAEMASVKPGEETVTVPFNSSRTSKVMSGNSISTMPCGVEVWCCSFRKA